MKIITFGEVMLRLSPPGVGRFVQADSLTMHFGGTEANVAVSLPSLVYKPTTLPGFQIMRWVGRLQVIFASSMSILNISTMAMGDWGSISWKRVPEAAPARSFMTGWIQHFRG